MEIAKKIISFNVFAAVTSFLGEPKMWKWFCVSMHKLILCDQSHWLWPSLWADTHGISNLFKLRSHNDAWDNHTASHIWFDRLLLKHMYAVLVCVCVWGSTYFFSLLLLHVILCMCRTCLCSVFQEKKNGPHTIWSCLIRYNYVVTCLLSYFAYHSTTGNCVVNYGVVSMLRFDHNQFASSARMASKKKCAQW